MRGTRVQTKWPNFFYSMFCKKAGHFVCNLEETRHELSTAVLVRKGHFFAKNTISTITIAKRSSEKGAMLDVWRYAEENRTNIVAQGGSSRENDASSATRRLVSVINFNNR